MQGHEFVIQINCVDRLGLGPVNVRIIAATHRNLEEMIRSGEFREDLYYRLNIIPLRIRPLRERPEDIPLLAQHLIRKICAKLNKPEICLTKDSVEYLMAQRWPGNVRQLENTIERILNLMGTMGMQNEEFYDWVNLEPARKQVGQAEHDCIKIPVHDEWPTLKEIVSEVEKQVLLRVLKNHPSSRKAARVLGVTNTTILNKIKSYGIVSSNMG